MHVSGLYIYPVKSLRGMGVASMALDRLGPAGDRRFMIVDEHGRFLTQRTLPQMALIATDLTPDTLKLTAVGHGSIQVSRGTNPASSLRKVSVWRSENLRAEDCGDPVAEWLSGFLGVRCRLVRAGAQFHRPVGQPGTAHADSVLGFADGFPLTLISEASLANLNDRLLARGEEPLPMNRFRPNIVVADCDAFAEDFWTRIRVGQIILRTGGACARCVVTTTDQDTAERGSEPLRTLALYRRDPTDSASLNFGQNFLPETHTGALTVGASVELVS